MAMHMKAEDDRYLNELLILNFIIRINSINSHEPGKDAVSHLSFLLVLGVRLRQVSSTNTRGLSINRHSACVDTVAF